MKLKPIEDQTIVITGASSGIGLATARMAAQRGARVVLAARNERALEQAVRDIQSEGGEATYVVADVTKPADTDGVADVAVETFGGFDSWVNGAGVGMYGLLEDQSLEDMRRLFDVTFWGVVHGCRSALPHLRLTGGALINVGSVESDRGLPLQGMYSAAKHAVKGYTEVLRIELEKANAPVSVTLIKPSSIDTPFFRHARNYMPFEPRAAPPVYAPDVVAEVILKCAEHPTRDVIVGGGGKAISEVNKFAPQLTDKLVEKTQFDSQIARIPAQSDDILYYPSNTPGEVRGTYGGHVMTSSVYTTAKLHRGLGLAALVGLGVAVAAGMRTRR